MAENYFALRDDLLRNLEVINELGPRQPKLSASDDVIIFQRGGNAVSFLGIATVVEAKLVETEKLQRLKLSEIKFFEEERDLSVIAGSLERTYRYLSPEKHFNRKVLRLSPRDFRSIVDYDIDEFRSIYRYLFSAMPIELRADFVRRYIESFPLTQKGEVTGYEEICPKLVAYYREHIGDTFLQIDLVMQRFEELQGIRNVGERSDFVLTDASSENSIAFGQTAWRVSRILEENAIFSRDMRLLRESEKELGHNAAVDDKQKDRTWRDPIF